MNIGANDAILTERYARSDAGLLADYRYTSGQMCREFLVGNILAVANANCFVNDDPFINDAILDKRLFID